MTSGLEFEKVLPLALQILSRRGSELLPEASKLAGKIMSQFVVLSKFNRKHFGSEFLQRLLFLASVLAEIVRQQSNLQLPFTSEFLTQLFEIEVEDIPLEYRSQMLTVLAVLYNNLIHQSGSITRLKVGNKLKAAILANYPLVEEALTLKLFNRAILNLQIRHLALFTLPEIERYGIKKALMKTLGEEKAQTIEKYLERLFPKKQSKPSA